MNVRTEAERKEALMSFTENGTCINCGTCTAVCPLPPGQAVLPRHLLRLLQFGEWDELVQRSESIYSCLLCRLCEETCPAGVNIAACVRHLRSHMSRSVHRLEEK